VRRDMCTGAPLCSLPRVLGACTHEIGAADWAKRQHAACRRRAA